MTDRNTERGEQRKDQRDPLAEREPQEDARRNPAPSREQGGRDAGRPGSETGGGD
jgi:hypothetical protein